MLKLIRKLLDKRGLASGLAISITLLLLLMPSKDSDQLSISIPFADKLIHFSLFAGCAFFIAIDCRIKEQSGSKQYILLAVILLTALLLSIWIEFMQGKYLARTSSKADVVANMAGVVFGLASAYFVYNLLFLNQQNKISN